MEDQTLLQRFHRECPFTYEQLYANVDFFCQSHDLPIDAANVFAEDWVNHWEQLMDLHQFLVALLIASTLTKPDIRFVDGLHKDVKAP